jgi:hypothetical protein
MALMPPELEVIASILEGLVCKFTNKFRHTKVSNQFFDISPIILRDDVSSRFPAHLSQECRHPPEVAPLLLLIRLTLFSPLHS